MNHLSAQLLPTLLQKQGLLTPNADVFSLPEKVLQFGTGVLLRGLPDYYIDKANRQGLFNGRVVVVKSTAQGDTDAFTNQDGLFTHCIKGVQNGNMVEEVIVNASISRVLSAGQQWSEVLKCAADPSMEIIISNTTEVGIALDKDDTIDANPPSSFPGKVLAFLYQRYVAFDGDPSKGMVIIPTELVPDNGKKLESIVLELAHLNAVDPQFMDWLENANHFCNSLVDRIVPGALPADEAALFKQQFGYTDDLMIMSEPYSLWAIEAAAPFVKEKLSFYKADSGVVIEPDINKFRELKLRLLNGTHTFSCGVAHLAGFKLVRDAMENESFANFVEQLMLQEIAPVVAGNDITPDEAKEFAGKVIDRFSNPFIAHKWLSIASGFTLKMKMRNLPLLQQHLKQNKNVPDHMAIGFAAYIRFMMCTVVDGKCIGHANGEDYVIPDEQAVWFAAHSHLPAKALVQAVLSNIDFWETDLTRLNKFADAVHCKLENICESNPWHIAPVAATAKRYTTS